MTIVPNPKTRISNRRTRLAVVNRFIDTLENRRAFLITGHANPDEDCAASMAAYALLLGKFHHPSVIVLNRESWKNFPYLLSICEYNSIRVAGSPDEIGDGFDTVVVVDTPKPAMMEFRDALLPLMEAPGTIVMEVDHHLGADGEYIGDPEYRLVDEASSSCELIGYLAVVISRKRGLMRRHGLGDMFTRNFVLAVVTGIVGDSKMGQYLKSRREKRYYRWFSRLFNRMLIEKTNKGSGNLSSIEEILRELEKLSKEEEECCRFFNANKQCRPSISWIALDERSTGPLLENFTMEVIVSVAKYVADVMAEESGVVSLVAYYDHPERSNSIQFRMRRSRNYTQVDLRRIIEELGIRDGGGHKGAVGFRVPKNQVIDFPGFIENIISRIVEITGRDA